MKKSYGMSAWPQNLSERMRAVEGCMLSVIIMPLVPSTSARWSYPYGAWRQTSMIASLPFAKRTMTLAVSNASGPSSALISGETWHDPEARTATGSDAIRKRAMSRSWIAMSLKMPPPPSTYFFGGGDGSRDVSRIWTGEPISPSMMALLTRMKLGSKRRCSATISLTPFSRAKSTLWMVSSSSVAIGFSQKMSLPAFAAAVICSAWNCDGEQIQTASTSGWLITSVSSLVHAMPG
mmetsp:Transcript_33921/g.112235  ORF Transcript_33921/g.112235 Transcript_33921/m.112235 type:complete len:236 (+) Transcript_33921:704-1411(+)